MIAHWMFDGKLQISHDVCINHKEAAIHLFVPFCVRYLYSSVFLSVLGRQHRQPDPFSSDIAIRS